MKLRDLILCLIALTVAVFVAGMYLRKQGETARRAAGLRNLQQWGVALNLYLMDNGNELPDVGGIPVHKEQAKAWYNALPPYISQTPLARIPPGQRPRPGIPSLWIRPDTSPLKTWEPEVFYFSYGMNGGLRPREGANSLRLHELKKPGTVIFLTEVGDGLPVAMPGNILFLPEGGTGRDEKARMIYCDGHAGSVLRAQFLNDPEAPMAWGAIGKNIRNSAPENVE